MRKRSVLAGVAAVAAVTGLVAPAASVADPAPPSSAVSSAGARTHLEELQKIAEANGNNRASGTPGYQASLDYVKGKLDQAGFVTSLQEFDSMGGKTFNLIAETKGGDPNNVVMLGSHLDSVREGPGINDNGTGVASILESALQYAGSGEEPKNKLRFAFWGAEEEGLVGSSHYVQNLSPEDQKKISLYLNFDMTGSSNAGYFTYDGDDSDGVGEGPGPEGSAQIEKLLNDAFTGAGVQTEGTDFDGRSDYGPFIEVGIPAGGSFSGAEETKTPEQAQKWGGEAGKAFDDCYHTPCDTLANVNQESVDRNFKVISHAVQTYATQPLPR